MQITTRQILIIMFLITTSITCQVKNIGIPEIRNYKRADYKGGTQNWNIDQDKNGILYFANNNGLFQFDGTKWYKYTLPNQSIVKSIKTQFTGKIFVGGYNEFGYFKSNSKGKLIYYSLSKFLKQSTINTIDMVWKIHLYKDEVIFQSFKNAFIFKNNILKTIKAPSRFQFSFEVGNQLYFQDVTNGLLEYKNGKLVPLEGTKVLNNTEIWGMFKMSNSKLLIATLDKGLFIYENNKISSWDTEVNTFIKQNSCLGGSIIKDKFIVLNSVLNGIIICDKTGKIIQHINRKKGLQNNTVLTSFVDAKNNLWLGLDNGITFINENSPFSYFGFSYDLSTVYASVVYKHNLYVATNQGLFYHSWNSPFKQDTFKLVEGTTGQAWNIQIIDDQLICAHNRGALLINGGKSIRNLNTIGYWGFKKIPNHPDYLIGANYNGFALFQKNSNGLQFVSQIKGLSKSVGEFEIEKETIWVIKDNLIFKMNLSEDLKAFNSIKTYKNLNSNNKGIGSIQRLRNRIYFQKNNHFYLYSQTNNSFLEDKNISRLFKKIPEINILKEDQKGNIWYVFNDILAVFLKKPNGSYSNSVTSFSNLTGNLVQNNLSINTIDSNNIFIGLTDGLAHYDSQLNNNNSSKPKAIIRHFTYSGNSLLFGNGQDKLENYTLPYAANNVKFSFASPTYENIENIKYSYQLEGFEDKWSNWTDVSLKEYTNLKEGDYIMKLRVKNSYGIQSDESKLSFSISPPWYRHFFAYLLYIFSITITIFYIRKRIQSKIRKNKYYETIEQRRLYLEKESKIRQEQFELEKEIESLKNTQLQIKILLKDKELVNNTLQVVKKNKILNGIIHKLKDIKVDSFDESTKFQFIKLNKSIVKEVNADHSWKDLEKHIKNVHYDFLKRLKEKFPTISPRELDLSTYLLMNMSTKEIAEIMNISSGGVELARYRLRKKLDLNKKENLTGFLMNI